MNHLILGQEYTILVEITLKKLKTSQKTVKNSSKKRWMTPEKYIILNWYVLKPPQKTSI